MLKLEDDGEHVRHIFTTDETHYPLSGTERLGSTPWGERVLRQAVPFLGRDTEAVEWAFPADCDLIASLGLGATMNVPITCFGRTRGSMNILHGEHSYDAPHLEVACSLAPYLALAFMRSV